jgi:hypothetical protein
MQFCEATALPAEWDPRCDIPMMPGGSHTVQAYGTDRRPPQGKLISPHGTMSPMSQTKRSVPQGRRLGVGLAVIVVVAGVGVGGACGATAVMDSLGQPVSTDHLVWNGGDCCSVAEQVKRTLMTSASFRH